MPPTPSAKSRPSEPVGSAWMSWWASASSPSFMIAPLPNCFSIWLTARSIARSRFTSIPMSRPPPHPGPVLDGRYRYCTLLSGASPAARLPFFGARSGHAAAEPHPFERLVDGSGPPEMTAIENDLGGRPGAEGRVAGRLDGAHDRPETPRRAHAAERHVAAERPFLGREAERLQAALAGGGELANLGHTAPQPGPQDAGTREAGERPQAPARERDGRGARRGGGERAADPGEVSLRDLAQEL